MQFYAYISFQIVIFFENINSKNSWQKIFIKTRFLHLYIFYENKSMLCIYKFNFEKLKK